jgi:CHAT domain-containing protein
MKRRCERFLLLVGGSGGPRALDYGDIYHAKIATQRKSGPPRVLSGADHEMDAIVGIFDGQAEVLRREESTRERLMSIARQYRVIHFAAHAGQGCDDEEDAIWLFNSADTGSLEKLRASDFTKMGLSAEMIVLSACRASWGEKDAMNRNLVGGILKAGVPSVVSALWAVDDKSTPFLMERFYGYLKLGERRARALQLAKLDMIQGGMDSPFYWASFVLIGDPSPLSLEGVDLKTSSPPHLVMGLLVLGSSVLLLFWIMRRGTKQRHA